MLLSPAARKAMRMTALSGHPKTGQRDEAGDSTNLESLKIQKAVYPAAAAEKEINAYTLGRRFEFASRRVFSEEGEAGRWAAEGRL